MHEHNSDSIVFQLQGDLMVVDELEEVMQVKLQVIKQGVIRPTKEDMRLWYKVFNKPMPKRASFIALLHTQRGIILPLIKHGNAKGVQIEFHGLQALAKDSYKLSDYATQLRATLKEFATAWKHQVRLLRFDMAIDLSTEWQSFSNSRKHRALCKKYGAGVFEHTTVYYQPKKPTYTKVLAYDKQVKNNLSYSLTRLEFRFLSQYWGKKIGAINDLILFAENKINDFIKKKLQVK